MEGGVLHLSPESGNLYSDLRNSSTVSTMGAPCSPAAAGRMKQAWVVRRRMYMKNFAALASSPSVDMEVHLLLNCPNSHCLHSMPKGSDHHLVHRLGESERCWPLRVLVELCSTARMLDTCASGTDDPVEGVERWGGWRRRTCEL